MKNVLVPILIVVAVISVAMAYRAELKHNAERRIGIYYEDGRLIIDGGNQTYAGNSVNVKLPEWLREKVLTDGELRDHTVRNFHFDYTGGDPDVIIIPEESNSIVVCEGNLGTKTFIYPNEVTK